MKNADIVVEGDPDREARLRASEPEHGHNIRDRTLLQKAAGDAALRSIDVVVIGPYFDFDSDDDPISFADRLYRLMPQVQIINTTGMMGGDYTLAPDATDTEVLEIIQNRF